jgi:hypothetical protein
MNKRHFLASSATLAGLLPAAGSALATASRWRWAAWGPSGRCTTPTASPPSRTSR